MTEQLDKVLGIITEAKANEDHLALGYDAFSKYVSSEFGDLLAGLARADRRAAVEVLDDLGLSTRAIASVVGTSHQTVANDLGTAGVKFLTPDPEPPFDPHHEDQVHRDDEGDHPALPAPVVGLDGKTYRREPRPQRRGSFPDSYRRALWNLDRARRRLEDLHADDRFARHRKELDDNFGRLLAEIAMTIDGLMIELPSGGVFPVKRGKKPISTRQIRAEAEAGGDDA